MPNRKDYPNWFYVGNEPRFFEKEPLKEIVQEVELERIQIFDLTKISLKEGKYALDVKVGHEGEWDEFYLVKYGEPIIKLNPNYKEELELYNKRLTEHKEMHKEWEALAEKWKAEEMAEKESAERKQLAKLKEKYEK